MSQHLDLYKILGVESNATTEIIRQAWHRKALEWHPDKRGLGDANAERMFKEIQRAYETLSNDMKGRMDDEILNDSNDENIASFTKHSPLQMGTRNSEAFEKKIDRWVNEYPTRKFVDNVDDEISSMVMDLLVKYKHQLKSQLTKKRCDVCHEWYYDQTSHEEHKQRVLTIFLAQYSWSTLDEYLASIFHDEWNWKPVSRVPSIIKELWVNEKWYGLRSLLDCIATPIEILKNASKKKPFAIDESLKSLTCSIMNIQPITYLPNILPFIHLIDYEHRTHKSYFFKTLTKSNDGDYRENLSGSICIVKETDDMHVLGKLMFRIEQIPVPVSKMERIKCEVCSERFTMLRGKHRCRMCGSIQCDSCQVWQTCRHLGYIQPVRICLPCSRRRHIYIAKVLYEQIERLIIQPYPDYTHFYLALLHHYAKDTDYNKIYQRASRYYWYKKEFGCVLQCYCYFATEQDWIQLAEQLCDEHSAYEFAAASFAAITTRDDPFWITKGNNYFEENRLALALLSYRQANLNVDDIWLALVSPMRDEARMILSYYIQWKVEKMTVVDKLKWICQLREHLTNEKVRPLAIRQLQLTSLSTIEWKDILEDLTNKREYTTAAEIFCTLYPYSLEFTHPFLRCASIFLRDFVIPVDEWMRDVISVDQTIMNVAFIHHLALSSNWTELQTEYFERKMYTSVMLCHKVRTILYSNPNIDTNWIEDGLCENEPIAYELKRLITGDDWKTLAEQSIHMGQYKRAMYYNYLRLDNSYPMRTTVQSVLKFAKESLSSNQMLQCVLAIYKKVKCDATCLFFTIQSLIECCQTSESIVNIIARSVYSIQSPKHHITLYALLLDELAKSKEFFEPYDACLHKLANTEKAQNLLKDHPIHFEAFVQQQLKSVVHQPILPLATVLTNINNIDAIEQILVHYFDEGSVANANGEFRAKMWLIIGVRDKLKNQYVNAVGSFHAALMCYPTKDTNAALLMLLQDSKFGEALLDELLLNLSELNLDKLSGFGCGIESPPTMFTQDNCLKASTHLTFIFRYEQAILKQSNGPSLQTALSYIDMCDATHDPTIIVSNLLLAGVHFYNMLLKQRVSPAFVYAYRQSIERLCNEAFHLTVHYLSPPMQNYACRLMITLLCRATSAFRTVTRSSIDQRIIEEKIVSKRCISLISQLLDRTIHLTHIAPLINIPVSLTFDVIYFELIGESFLMDYLDVMSKKQAQSMLYQYYILEGIWIGWITDRTFSNARQMCMEALLTTKQWNMFDVQKLLQISIVPRTSDGWLCRERLPLILTRGDLCFQRAEGISVDMRTGHVDFLFQPALSPNDGLFDEKDVAEVLQCGLSATYFSLDQPEGNLLYHPFQEIKYKPQTLVNTRYLETMLHTDYLLKMFTTGVEVSAKIPFATRPINDGFFQRLPEHLRHKLRPLHENRAAQKNNTYFSHRFWIQPDDTTFEEAEDGANQLSMRVGSVRIRVRKRRLVRNDRGALIDDDDEDLDEQQSPESQFARFFTENYDEIGEYFPELLRLKELVKLGIILIFLRTAYKILAQPVSVDSLSRSLAEWRSDIKYPNATYANQIIKYNECLARNWASAAEVPWHEEQRVKGEILRHLENIDQQTVDMCADIIHNEFHSSDRYTARACTKQWLESNKSDGLVNIIANSLNIDNRKCLEPIEQLHIKFNDNEEALEYTANFCNWVPAAFHIPNINRRVYGGLCLYPGLIPGTVPITSRIRRYNALTVINASMTKKHPEEKHPRANVSGKASAVPACSVPIPFFSFAVTNPSNATRKHSERSNFTTGTHSSEPPATQNRIIDSTQSDIPVHATDDRSTQQNATVKEDTQTPQETFSSSTTSSNASACDISGLVMDCNDFQLSQYIKRWLQNYDPVEPLQQSPLIQYVKKKYIGIPLTLNDSIDSILTPMLQNQLFPLDVQVPTTQNRNVNITQRDIPVHGTADHSTQQNATVKEDTQTPQETSSSSTTSSNTTARDAIGLLRRSNELWLREYKREWLQNQAIKEESEQSSVRQDLTDEEDVTDEEDEKNIVTI